VHIYARSTVPNSAQNQAGRRNAIRDILGQGPADTQQSLVDALISRGFVATQSSVSRDLRDLGAIKTARGYELPGVEGGANEIVEVSGLLRDMQAAGPNLVVIKTAIGAAQRVGLALDRSGRPEMVGSIAGDDTVFVATRNAAGQRNLVAKIDRAQARA
jgi:transcriptional regulator of arginine metabolism